MTVITERMKQEFLRRFVPGENGQCWTRGRFSPNGKGYPGFTYRDGGTTITGPAHRVAYTLFKGDIPEGMQVRHSCAATPSCISPAHLYVGTSRDNAIDKRRAGRIPRGGARRDAKRTGAQVQRYRDMYAAGMTIAQIAQDTGENKRFIGKVVSGQSWTHLGGRIERRCDYVEEDGQKVARYTLVCIHPAEQLPDDYDAIPVAHVPLDHSLPAHCVVDLKVFRSLGANRASVARMFMVSINTVQAIDDGRLYADIPGPAPSRTGPLSGHTWGGRRLPTREDAAEIKRRRGEGERRSEVAAAYGISIGTVALIDQGKLYASVPGPAPKRYTPPKREAKPPREIVRGGMTPALAHAIKRDLAAGMTVSAVAIKHKRAESTIRDIARGTSWGWVDATSDQPGTRPHTRLGSTHNSSITQQDVARVLALMAKGSTAAQAAYAIGIPKRAATHIANRTQYVSLIENVEARARAKRRKAQRTEG